MSNPGFPTRTGANGTPPSPPPRTRLEPFSSRGDGTRGGTNALKSALTLRKYRAGYQIRTGDLQLGKASQTFAATALPSHSSPLAVSWRPKTSRVVALEVGFEVGSPAAQERAGSALTTSRALLRACWGRLLELPRRLFERGVDRARLAVLRRLVALVFVLGLGLRDLG
jgi:hypothetical protein